MLMMLYVSDSWLGFGPRLAKMPMMLPIVCCQAADASDCFLTDASNCLLALVPPVMMLMMLPVGCYLVAARC